MKTGIDAKLSIRAVWIKITDPCKGLWDAVQEIEAEGHEVLEVDQVGRRIRIDHRGA